MLLLMKVTIVPQLNSDTKPIYVGNHGAVPLSRETVALKYNLNIPLNNLITIQMPLIDLAFV